MTACKMQHVTVTSLTVQTSLTPAATSDVLNDNNDNFIDMRCKRRAQNNSYTDTNYKLNRRYID